MPFPSFFVPTDDEPDFLTFAAIALDLHRTTGVATQTGPASRYELDALHSHLVALHHLLDAHAHHTHPIVEAEGDHLAAARNHLWQAAEQLHFGYHHAPRADGVLPESDVCHRRLPEGAPDVTICQRHIGAASRVRRHSTPTDLRSPGASIGHAKKETR